jgi:hypothetical protein
VIITDVTQFDSQALVADSQALVRDTAVRPGPFGDCPYPESDGWPGLGTRLVETNRGSWLLAGDDAPRLLALGWVEGRIEDLSYTPQVCTALPDSSP